MAVVVQDVADVATLSDAYAIQTGAVLRDTAVVLSAVTSTRFAPVTVTESAELSSYAVITHVGVELVYETAELSSRVVEGLQPDDLFDSAVVTSAASYRVVSVVDVLETAVGGDSAFSTPYNIVYETAAITSSVTLFSRLIQDVFETAVISSAVDDVSGERLVDVLDTAVATSSVTTALVAREVAHEICFGESWIYSGDGAGDSSGWPVNDAWTCNVATWAMSRYADCGIDDLGTRFAVSSTGLYERSGAYADARFETGFLDFGAKMKKRVPHLYIQGSYDGSLDVEVTGEVNGTRGTYSYTPEADITGVPTTVRVDIGRKLSGTYIQFALISSGRAEFFGCEAHVDATQRRI